MAKEDSGQEKTIEPTPERIREAQEKGEFARSKEITTVAIFLAMLGFFATCQSYILGHLMETVSFFLRFDSFVNLTPGNAPDLFWLVLFRTAPIVLPFLGLVFFVGMAAEMGQVGIQSVKDPLEPKWDRLNPVAGFQRISSLKQLVEGLKSVLKLSIFCYVAYLTIRQAMPQLAVLNQSTPLEGANIMIALTLKLGFRTCAVLLFLSGFDYLYQRWQYFKNLRMTPQEFKEEIKEREGDPVMKQRIRSIQMDIARKRMMAAIPDSDVVLTNPTHYAVALRYDPEKGNAPVVVAKGQNYVAQRIREIAAEAGVPLVEDPPLARALFKKVAIGNPIPYDLFKAVSQILASIWALSKKRGRSWAVRK